MPRDVAFGISLTLYGDRSLSQTIGDYVELCRLAERNGFDSAWLGESHLQKPGALTAAPFQIHAALARHTTLRLGAVTLAPLWHPLKLAYETAVLDGLSDGRLMLIAGVGPTVTVTGRYGVPYEELGGRTDELLVMLRRLWRGEPAGAGRYFTAEGAIWPLPVQPGGPPLFVAGALRRSVRRAAELGDGWYGASIYLRDEYARLAEQYREELARLGKDPAAGTVGCNRTLILAEDDADLHGIEPYVERIHRYYAELGYLKRPDGSHVAPYDADLATGFGDELLFKGHPEQVAESVLRYIDLGINRFHFRISPGGLPREHAERTIRLFGERVLPLVRARLG